MISLSATPQSPVGTPAFSRADRAASQFSSSPQSISEMSYVFLGAGGAVGGSTVPPAFFQAPKPPWIWATGFSPLRAAICAASAERKPPAQKNTNFLSCPNTGLKYEPFGSIQNSSMPRGQWNAP